MKTPPFSTWALAVGLAAFGAGFAGEASAQSVVPANPGGFTTRKTGDGRGGIGGGSSVGVSTIKRDAESVKPIVIQYVAVSKVRDWTNTQGKKMQARLLAFSAPKQGQTGPVEVIRDGKVRFLLATGKEPIDYPLEQLSQPDQIDIKAIAQAAKRAPNAKAKGEGESKEGAKPEGSGKKVEGSGKKAP